MILDSNYIKLKTITYQTNNCNRFLHAIKCDGSSDRYFLITVPEGAMSKWKQTVARIEF